LLWTAWVGVTAGCCFLWLSVCLQALVEHFAGMGQPDRVEACVVHLPIMSLDLNQVCWVEWLQMVGRVYVVIVAWQSLAHHD
jgi:hypothetical protein